MRLTAALGTPGGGTVNLRHLRPGRGVTVTCGPHAKKRRGQSQVMVSQADLIAEPLFEGGPLAHYWVVSGSTDQHANLIDGRETFDEVPARSGWRSEPYEVDSEGEPFEHGPEVEGAVRLRRVLACPVCRTTVVFRDAREHYELLARLLRAGVREITLHELEASRHAN